MPQSVSARKGLRRAACLSSLLPLLLPAVWAQAPASPQAGAPPAEPALGNAAHLQQAAPQQDMHMNGMPKNPHLFGMEIPLLDPACDMISCNGGKYDVGNNALLRSRSEKYLQQRPESGLYPGSALARAGIERVAELVMNASY